MPVTGPRLMRHVIALRLESGDYLRIGERIARLGLPTLFLMEGGYAVEEIGIDVVNVLAGYQDCSAPRENLRDGLASPVDLLPHDGQGRGDPNRVLVGVLGEQASIAQQFAVAPGPAGFTL